MRSYFQLPGVADGREGNELSGNPRIGSRSCQSVGLQWLLCS
jgi:hypothetical protein